MGELTASGERIRASSAFAPGKADEMEGGIASFVSQVDGFLSGSWHGQGSEAYRPLFEDWAANAERAQQALSEMAGLLGSSAGEYDRQEEDNDESIKAVEVDVSKIKW